MSTDLTVFNVNIVVLLWLKFGLSPVEKEEENCICLCVCVCVCVCVCMYV